MNLADNPNLHKSNVLKRFYKFNAYDYSVVDVESGDRIKFMTDIFTISIESSNAEQGYLICLWENFGRDGISFIEKDNNNILDRIEDVLKNGL